jgi:glycerate 2-kinase
MVNNASKSMSIQPDQFFTASLRILPHGYDICRILAEAINNVDPFVAMRKHLFFESDSLTIAGRSYDLTQFHRILVIGAGKAVVPMLMALYDLLGNRISAGVVITKQGYVAAGQFPGANKISIIEASHPVPGQSNLDASSRLVRMVDHLGPQDLVICLLSGGGSALLLKPAPAISLADLQAATQLLLSSGAEIGEINTIRKHLDELKGGQLAKIIYPATLISLILSDVIGDHLDQIASGPTTADPTSFEDAWNILSKYHLVDQVPPSVSAHIQAGMQGHIPETIKPADPILERVHQVIIGNNLQAVNAALGAAASFGFSTLTLTTTLHGEASQVGRLLVETARSLLSSPIPLPRPACFVAGGETTVTLHGCGQGGRNQELALGAVDSLAGEAPMLLVSLATDGGDGPTDAAGAVVTNHTRASGLSLGLDASEYLSNNDAYHYFDNLGDLIKTGPTLTNVNDLVLIFAL